MSKHAIPTIWPDVETRDPAHSKGWNSEAFLRDALLGNAPYTPGKHAKPFGRHSIRSAQDIYNRYGQPTPLNPPTHALDAVA